MYCSVQVEAFTNKVTWAPVPTHRQSRRYVASVASCAIIMQHTLCDTHQHNHVNTVCVIIDNAMALYGIINMAIAYVELILLRSFKLDLFAFMADNYRCGGSQE